MSESANITTTVTLQPHGGKGSPVPGNQFTALWKQALDDFSKESGTKAARIWTSEFTNCSLQQLCAKVEKQIERYKLSMSRRQKILKTLNAFLEPVGAFCKVVGPGASLIARGIGSTYDAIIELLDKITYSGDRLYVYLKTEIPQGLATIAQSTIVLHLRIFAISIKMMRESNFSKRLAPYHCYKGLCNKEIFAKKTFLGNDCGINDTIERLKALEHQEEMLVNALAYNATQQIIQHLGIGVISGITAERSEDQGLHDSHGSKSKINLLERRISSQERVFWSKKDDRYKTVKGGWILDETKFRDWFRRDFPILWICGLPGTGKSYLAYHLVQALRQLNWGTGGRPTKVSVLYFFTPANLTNHDVLITRELLGNIMDQFASQDSLYDQYVKNMKWQSMDHDPLALWKNYIFDFFTTASSSSAVMVFYGIENLHKSERETMFKVLGMMNKTTSRVSVILLTNYDIGDEVRQGIGALTKRIEMEPEKTKSDVDKYIGIKVHGLMGFGKGHKLRNKVIEFLRTNANGSYLWVDTMIENCPLDEGWRVTMWMENPPEQWYEAFEKSLSSVVEGLKPYQRETLNYILSWVITATRPLSLRALDQALYIRTNDGAGVNNLTSLIYYKYGSIFDIRTSHGVQADNAAEDEFSEDDEREDATEIGKPEDEAIFVSIKQSAILNYFLQEKFRPQRDLQLSVIDSRLMVLKTCLRIFSDDRKYKACETSLAKFAATFQSHLLTIEPAAAPPEDRREIGQLLAQILRVEPVLKRWVSKAGQSLTTDFLLLPGVIRAIQDWLSDPKVEQHLEALGHTRDWYASLRSTPYAGIFGQVARSCAQRWLQSKDAHADTYVVFLHNYDLKVNERRDEPFSSVKQLAPERIVNLWKDSQAMIRVDKPIYRHRLASTLLYANYVPEAIQNGKAAITEGHDDGLVHTVLGQAYMRAEDFENAYTHLQLGQTRLSKEETEARMRNFLRLYRLRGDSSPPITEDLLQPYSMSEDYLDELIRHGDFSEATGLIDKLVTVKLSKYPGQRWLDFFENLARHIPHHRRLVIYAQAWPRGVELVERLYERGLKVLARWRKEEARLAMLYFFSQFRICLNSRAEDIDPLLEIAIEDLSIFSIEEDIKKLRYIAEIDLRSFRLNLAIKTPMYDTATMAQHTAFYDALAEKIQQENRLASPSALTVAVWYRHINRRGDCHQILRPLLLEAIDSIKADLGSSAVTNNGGKSAHQWTAWYKLADALNAVGERRDAVATLSYIKQSRISQNIICYLNPRWSSTFRQSPVNRPVITWSGPTINSTRGNPKPEDINIVLRWRTERQELFDAVQAQYPAINATMSGPYSGYTCDGCGKVISCCETSYRCTVCLHIDFCYHCWEMLQAGKMRINVCDASHILLMLPAEYVACSRGKIRVGYQNPASEDIEVRHWIENVKACERDIEEWLASIIKTW